MSIEKARKHTVFRAFLLIKTYYLFSAYVSSPFCTYLSLNTRTLLFSNAEPLRSVPVRYQTPLPVDQSMQFYYCKGSPFFNFSALACIRSCSAKGILFKSI